MSLEVATDHVTQMTDERVEELVLDFLTRTGPTSDMLLSLGLASSMRDLGLSNDQLEMTVDEMLASQQIFLTSQLLLSASNETGELNLYRLKRILQTVEKPKLFANFRHAVQLFEESSYLLNQVVAPRARQICDEWKKTLIPEPSFVRTMQRLPNPSFTLYLKAYHFNMRALFDEILRILNQLAFVLKKPDAENSTQPSTTFGKFYKQYSARKLDFLDDKIITFFDRR